MAEVEALEAFGLELVDRPLPPNPESKQQWKQLFGTSSLHFAKGHFTGFGGGAVVSTGSSRYTKVVAVYVAPTLEVKAASPVEALL